MEIDRNYFPDVYYLGTDLYLPQQTLLRIFKTHLHVGASVPQLATLILRAVDKEYSLCLKYTERLKDQAKTFCVRFIMEYQKVSVDDHLGVVDLTSQKQDNDELSWSCRVLASVVDVGHKRFQILCKVNVMKQACANEKGRCVRHM